MIWKRRLPGGTSEPAPQHGQHVCVDRQRAEVIHEEDVWTQVRLPDGTTPNVLTARTTPCTCDGNGCTR
ncbi:hypothetical protein [Streptosporangium sp. NPDC051022]|uniref:hypothetical protein n=1 Tax=Streptosporangium sp. NPDC051022 TaxID=3155752 RepID=UPI00341D31BE